MKKANKGFTLIELLIVIAIIGLLATLAIVSLTSAQRRARDTKRVADIKSIQTGLELYWNENTEYPHGVSFSTWSDISAALSNYMGALPTDPEEADGTHYYYLYDLIDADSGTAEDDEAYWIRATLEDGSHQALTQDNDENVAGTALITELYSSDGTAKVVGEDADLDCQDTASAYCVYGVATTD